MAEKTYVLIVGGKVVNRALFDGDMPGGWAGQGETWINSEEAQIGWAYEGGAFVAPVPEVPVPSAEQAKSSIIAAIDAVTAAILAPYPSAERMSFDAKAAEALAVLGADPETFDLAIAPLLAAECAAETGAAATRSVVAAKAGAVAQKAAQWGALAATLSGIRQRAFAAIDEEGEDIAAVRDAALAEIGGLAVQVQD